MSRASCLSYGVTVKVDALVAAPPAVVTAILPVFAPVGTAAVICVAESTLNAVALTPPKVTALAPVSAVPVIFTMVLTGPLSGLIAVMVGITLNLR